MDQDALNLNVQERLRSLEATREVFVALAVALIETHPDPAALRKRFNAHYEAFYAKWLNSPLYEDWLTEGARLHALLDGTFPPPRP